MHETQLLTEGTAEDMLAEYAEKMFRTYIGDPLSGIRSRNFSGMAHNIESGLEFMYINSYVARKTMLTRGRLKSSDILAVYFFYGSSFDYLVESSVELSVQDLVNGIIIHNYSSDVKLLLMENREFNFVVVRIRPQSFFRHFPTIAPELQPILFGQKPLLIYENLNQDILDHLKTVTHIQTAERTSKYLVFGKTIELLALAFELLLKRRGQSKSPVRIPEYNSIVRAKNFLISDLRDAPSIEELSKYMGMSATKAKTLFKQVYGYAPHQYLKVKKMERAKQLIHGGSSSIGEIGHALGYKSLSHFSSDFKRHYGITPKKMSLNFMNA
jgi:AraC-like DNA-binding protein